MFTRASYFNTSQPFLITLGELRTLFRPNTPLWTHLYSGEGNFASIPSKAAVAAESIAQDATWSLAATPNDSYVTQFSDFFTKYSFSEQWRNHKAHGMYADGSTSNGTAYGAWLVHNTVETYYGGPLHSDFMVDGIVVSLAF
jgi:rhamnogalacturonan endolyase